MLRQGFCSVCAFDVSVGSILGLDDRDGGALSGSQAEVWALVILGTLAWRMCGTEGCSSCSRIHHTSLAVPAHRLLWSRFLRPIDLHISSLGLQTTCCAAHTRSGAPSYSGGPATLDRDETPMDTASIDGGHAVCRGVRVPVTIRQSCLRWCTALSLQRSGITAVASLKGCRPHASTAPARVRGVAAVHGGVPIMPRCTLWQPLWRQSITVRQQPLRHPVAQRDVWRSLSTGND